MHRLWLAWSIVCLLILSSFSVFSEENLSSKSLVQARAEKLIFEQDKNLLILEGDVHITADSWLISAPKLEINLSTQEIYASQGVEITKIEKEKKKQILSAEQARINLKTQKGYLISAKLILPTDQGELTIKGAEIKKIGENLYYLNQGTFTSCQCPEGKNPDWEIFGKKVNADVEGNLKMRSAKILIKGHTIFYLPYIEYPLSSRRRSGFLPPEFLYSSRSGYQATLPFYLVLSNWSDFTFYPSWLEKRGFQAGAEYRYNLKPISEGILAGWIINDQKEERTRWSGLYQAQSFWKQGWLWADIRLVSDNEYIIDFPQNLAPRWQRALESKIGFEQNLTHCSLAGEFSWLDDLVGWDIRQSPIIRPDQDSLIIQRLPSIYYTLYNKELGAGVGIDLSARFHYLWREEVNLGRGSELSFFPRINYAPNLAKGFYLFSYAGYKLSALKPDPEFWQKESFIAQPILGLNFGIGLEKIYQEKIKNKYRHLIYPQIMVNYFGKSSKPDDPFFQQILNTDERGELGLTLTSMVFKKSLSQQKINLTSRFELRQFYSWTEKELYDLEAHGFFQFGSYLGLNTDLYYNFSEGKWHRAQALLWAQDKKNRRLWLGYSLSSGEIKTHWYKYLQEETEDYNFGTSLPISQNLNLQYQLNYSAYYNKLVWQSLRFDYLSKQKCWQVSFTFRQRINPEDPSQPPEYSTAINFQIIASSEINLGVNLAGANQLGLSSTSINK